MTTESALAGERLLLKGAKGAEITRLAAGGLTPVQRVIMLGRIPLFSRISAEELLHLAAIATEVPLVNGNRLVGGADPSALYVVLSGALSLDAPAGSRDEAPLTVGPGDAIGIYETLAGVSLGRAVQAVRDGVALHITSDDLFDLLAHQSDLLKQLFGALFSTQDTATTPVGA